MKVQTITSSSSKFAGSANRSAPLRTNLPVVANQSLMGAALLSASLLLTPMPSVAADAPKPLFPINLPGAKKEVVAAKPAAAEAPKEAPGLKADYWARRGPVGPVSKGDNPIPALGMTSLFVAFVLGAFGGNNIKPRATPAPAPIPPPKADLRPASPMGQVASAGSANGNGVYTNGNGAAASAAASAAAPEPTPSAYSIPEALVTSAESQEDPDMLLRMREAQRLLMEVETTAKEMDDISTRIRSYETSSRRKGVDPRRAASANSRAQLQAAAWEYQRERETSRNKPTKTEQTNIDVN